MPELPDVEAFLRVVAEHATGRPVRTVEVTDSGVLRGFTADALREQVSGRRLGAPRRHGKWLIVPTGRRGALLLHFGMTGSLECSSDSSDRRAHDRVVFCFHDGELRYRDQRKLKGIQLVSDEAGIDDRLGDIGPDALAISRGEFGSRVTASRRGAKSALTDQSVVAGLGNLLVDEILWRARIDPRRSCADLGRADVTRLHGRMTTVLRAASRAGRVPPRPSWLTGRRDQAGAACPRCGTELRHERVNGRGTVWCPRCQSS